MFDRPKNQHAGLPTHSSREPLAVPANAPGPRVLPGGRVATAVADGPAQARRAARVTSRADSVARGLA